MTNPKYDPETRKKFRKRIIELAKAGGSPTSIAEAVNKEGFKTPSGKAHNNVSITNTLSACRKQGMRAPRFREANRKNPAKISVQKSSGDQKALIDLVMHSRLTKDLKLEVLKALL